MDHNPRLRDGLTPINSKVCMCGYERDGSTTAIFSATILISYSTNTNQTIIVATCYPLTNPSK